MVERLALSPAQFIMGFMHPNTPVIIKGLVAEWPATRDWQCNGRPAVGWIKERFGDVVVPVAFPPSSGAEGYGESKRTQMRLADYLSTHMTSGGSSPGTRSGTSASDDQQSLRPPERTSAPYLKDWHAVRDLAGYRLYTTPPHFREDWLNAWWDSKSSSASPSSSSPASSSSSSSSADDYRFCYLGPKGTWTPCHRDVLASYSWSTNVCGRKLWLLFPPDAAPLLVNHRGECIPDVFSAPSASVLLDKCVRVVQEAGETIFVPSGWYHQVHNLEDTLSLNHNWLKAFNLPFAWAHLQEERRMAREAMSGFFPSSSSPSAPSASSSGDGQEEGKGEGEEEVLLQRIIGADAGMDYAEFARFLDFSASREARRLEEALEALSQEASATSSASSSSSPPVTSPASVAAALVVEKAESEGSSTEDLLLTANIAILGLERCRDILSDPALLGPLRCTAAAAGEEESAIDDTSCAAVAAAAADALGAIVEVRRTIDCALGKQEAVLAAHSDLARALHGFRK